jgi:hypothetical protein
MQIAETLLLSDDTIRQHIMDYKTYQKLAPKSGGSVEKLNLKTLSSLKNT